MKKHLSKILAVLILLVFIGLTYYFGIREEITEITNLNNEEISNKNNGDKIEDNIKKLQVKWSKYIKKYDKDNQKSNDNNDNLDIKVSALQQLPFIGQEIKKFEKELTTITDLDQKRKMYDEYHSLQQDYLNILNLVESKRIINAEMRKKIDEYKRIKKEYESKGELSEADKEKLANIKRKIIYNE